MRRTVLLLIAAALLLTACGAAQGDNTNTPADTGKKISFEAYVKEGETFDFELDPGEAVSYADLKNNTLKDSLSNDNWESYFAVKEVYREQYEYDDEGNQTATYMKGYYDTVTLLDDYYYADNWTRNGLEFEMYINGEETRVMTNEGIVYDPEVEVYDEVKTFAGADNMLILTDFENSWDEVTNEKYTGVLNSYEMISPKGDLYLLKASAVEFKKYKDNIYYFAACADADEYFVIFIQTDDSAVDREKEYDAAIYTTTGYGETERYTGYDKIYTWNAIIELMDKVDEYSE